MELSVGSGLGVCRGAWRRRKMRCILYTSLLAALATSTLGNTAPHLRHFDLIVVKVYRHRSGLLLHHISASRTVRVFCRDSLSETKARRYHSTRQRSTTPDRQPYTATNTTPQHCCLHHPLRNHRTTLVTCYIPHPTYPNIHKHTSRPT